MITYVVGVLLGLLGILACRALITILRDRAVGVRSKSEGGFYTWPDDKVK